MDTIQSPPPQRPGILLIDDSVDAIEVLGKCLEDEADLRFALSGEDGLRLARQWTPDLIVLDIEMQHFGGFTVLSELRRDPRLADTPVLFASSHTDHRVESKAFQEGGVGFIKKPFEPELVRHRVKQALSLAPRDAANQTEEPRRLLLATTDNVLATKIGDMLRREGVEMIFTTDATAIVAVASVGCFEQIIIDDNFRTLTAEAICRELRGLDGGATAPILVIATQADPATELRLVKAGCTDVIERHGSWPLLQARIRLALR